MKTISINSLGPIKNGNINFGDLTLFVGGHASGKSIVLQLLKLLVDKDHIRRTIEQYGFIWGNTVESVIERYFGEGMSNIINEETSFILDDRQFSIEKFLTEQIDPKYSSEESLFYIPAQRVVCLQNGWPRFFTDYEDSVPYVLRHFSETLRQYLETGINKKNDTIFPQNEQLKAPLRESFNNSIFHDGKITLDKTVKKRFKLNIGNSSIPYMTWSAGQKEFMPLLLSFYWLCPPSSSGKKDGVKYVVIEEPEMGLHPQAIESVILQVIDLLSRDYKVIISTHSPVLLEFAWAFKYLKATGSKDNLLAGLFNIKESYHDIFNNILETKDINTYYFDRINKQVEIKDISTLDAGSEDVSVAEWGGLSSFSSKASDIIAKIMANKS